MNPKLERVTNEIDKTKGKLSAMQARLRDLEKQKINLENEEIVVLYRRETKILAVAGEYTSGK